MVYENPDGSSQDLQAMISKMVSEKAQKESDHGNSAETAEL